MDILLQYLIICPLVMVAGFVDAIAGGGGLISLPAYLISGLPVHNAIATNKMSSTMGTVLATFKFARSGFIPWKLALTCVCFAFAGSSLGARLALLMDSHIFLLFMVVVLPLTAIYVTRGKALIVEKNRIPIKRRRFSASSWPFSSACTMDSTVPAPVPFSCSFSPAWPICL